MSRPHNHRPRTATEVILKEEKIESVLELAARLVHGDRGESYGNPYDDFTRVGKMWGAVLGTGDVPPDKVALCMICLKVSREANKHKRDNIVDIAGYAETLDMVRFVQNIKDNLPI